MTKNEIINHLGEYTVKIELRKNGAFMFLQKCKGGVFFAYCMESNISTLYGDFDIYSFEEIKIALHNLLNLKNS